MIAIRELDHIVLRVADLPAMGVFYREVLGCPVERRREDLGLLQLRAGRSLLDLVPVDGPLGRAGGRAPGTEGATSITSASGWSPSTRRRSAPTWRATVSPPVSPSSATAPTAHPSICKTRKAM